MIVSEIFSQFKNQHIAVVGDAMLDTYWWGNAERISPEAPVPVVAMQKKEYRIGGAGNVALNLAKLGAQVSMHTVTGADEDGLLLEMMLADNGVNTDGVWKSAERLTTNKIRVISRSQHLLRIDQEDAGDLSDEQCQRFISKTIDAFEKQKPDAVIFEDYNKGVLTQKVVEQLIGWCAVNNVISTVDPKRKNFFAYRNATLFKPNLKEIREALNVPDLKAEAEELKDVDTQLRDILNHRISFVTLGEKGVFLADNGAASIIPAHIRNIADVSGAGDTVIAVATLVYAATNDPWLMAEVANIAGGLVCEQVGTVAIDAQRLQEECTRLLPGSSFGGRLADG